MKRNTVLKYTEPVLCYMDGAKTFTKSCSFFCIGMMGYNIVSGKWLYVLTSTLGALAFKKLHNELKMYIREINKLNKIGETHNETKTNS